jgi:hypothetical protein
MYQRVQLVQSVLAIWLDDCLAAKSVCALQRPCRNWQELLPVILIRHLRTLMWYCVVEVCTFILLSHLHVFRLWCKGVCAVHGAVVHGHTTLDAALPETRLILLTEVALP